MKNIIRGIGLGAAAALALAGTSAAQAQSRNIDDLLEMMKQFGLDVPSEEEKAEIAAKAADKPLGSSGNPIRAEMPQGQRAYLDRLRCEDGEAPKYARRGNVGPGIYRTIVDVYEVTCEGSTPARSEIYMDMYHKGFIENRAVEGFDIIVDGEAESEAEVI